MAITAGTWNPLDRIGLNQAIDTVASTQKHRLGERVRCRDVSTNDYGTGEFVYLKGVASTVAGDAVVYNPKTFATTRAVAASVGPLAVAMCDCVADRYGWYQVQGLAKTAHGTTAAAGAAVYTTATDGTLDGVAAISQQVFNAVQTADDDTGFALIGLQYPHAGATDVDTDT